MAKITLRIWILIACLFLALLAIAPSINSKGVLIKSVDKNSTAYLQGLRSNMIITEINGEPVNNIDDYSSVFSKIDFSSGEKKLTIKTKNNGEFIFLAKNPPEIHIGNVPRTRLKTGLDLSGGARALVRPVNVSLSDKELDELISVTNQRLNTFGISDITVRAARDLYGNRFMLIEAAGATPEDIKELVSKQGKFEAKIGNETIFGSGKEDIKEVCRNDAKCAGITRCDSSANEGYFCNFQFAISISDEAAQRHSEITKNLSLDQTGKYLSEKLYLYVDDVEMDSLLISADLRGRVTHDISIQGSGTGSSAEEAFKDAQNKMKRLQTILITGSLPYKLEIVKLDTISPILGKEFTKNLFYLGLFVFVAVSVIIFVKYRKIKITLAVILTMFSEALITLGIAALIKWNLDAPSIAGIIAGIGTGVNDQIVILDEAEDIGQASLKERVKRAFFIVLGAFFTIIAAMLPLLWAGAGLLKGFALTTIIGVSAGILVTRPAFSDILKKISG